MHTYLCMYEYTRARVHTLISACIFMKTRIRHVHSHPFAASFGQRTTFDHQRNLSPGDRPPLFYRPAKNIDRLWRPPIAQSDLGALSPRPSAAAFAAGRRGRGHLSARAGRALDPHLSHMRECVINCTNIQRARQAHNSASRSSRRASPRRTKVDRRVCLCARAFSNLLLGLASGLHFGDDQREGELGLAMNGNTATKSARGDKPAAALEDHTRGKHLVTLVEHYSSVGQTDRVLSRYLIKRGWPHNWNRILSYLNVNLDHWSVVIVFCH